MIEHPGNVDHQKGNQFWESFKKFFVNQAAGVVPVYSHNDGILTATEHIQKDALWDEATPELEFKFLITNISTW